MRVLFAGIDVGTQGVRVVVADGEGSVAASAERGFALGGATPEREAGRVEQDPEEWWKGVKACVAEILPAIREKGHVPEDIAALSVSSTSGTVMAVAEQGEPLTPAVMYNDARAQAEADWCNAALQRVSSRLGYRFSASFGLPKILWLSRHGGDRTGRRYVHAADFVAGRLTGRYDVTDETNALKSGYDLVEGRWPAELEREFGLGVGQLPRVVPSGTPVEQVRASVATELGLSPRTVVVAGMTDGVASQMAAGAVNPGDWNSTLGTTLVIKGVTAELTVDPGGRLYSHRHPAGWWILGGASNTGGEAVERRFGRERIREFDQKVLSVSPSGVILYPLEGTGERFPFLAPHAVRFQTGAAVGEVEEFAAHLEGVAYIERLSYEVVGRLGVSVPEVILASGGGAKSREWLQIRADVMQKVFIPALRTDGAMGGAINAAAHTFRGGLVEAVAWMARRGDPVGPRPEMAARYGERYAGFREELRRRGYAED